MKFPKSPNLSSIIKKGDIFVFQDGFYYKALHDGTINESPHPTNKAMWRKLNKGTLQFPKSLQHDDITSVGEVFKNFENDEYYRSTCVPKDNVSKHDCLQSFRYESEWMSLIKEDIGEVKLGDLAIPGSHDTATTGINEDSYLIDRNFLFRIGDLVAPEVMVNWSLTQDTYVLDQLNYGFRQLDLRIADCESFRDTFRWWHGLSADEIFGDLQDIADFSSLYPDEIIIIYFQNFVQPDRRNGGTQPIDDERKIELNEIILDYLSDHMVPYVNISDNPTVNEVLDTGKNIIATMQDDDIRGMSELYWPKSVVVPGFSGKPNPEDLFIDRSERLKDFLINHNNTITDISGAMTPGVRTVVAAIERVYGNVSIIGNISDIYDIHADNMSFEGVFVDLLNAGRYGINTNGMFVRPEDMYSNGISVHYRGINDMFRYWLARPGLFKPNIVYVDDSTEYSTIVSTAIEANMGEIPREATISFQGNTRNGFYYWETSFSAEGGDEGLYCDNISVRFLISSDPEPITDPIVTLQEGFYPPGTEITIEVTSQDADDWYELGTFDIDSTIDSHLDMYVRGDDLGGGSGFAYVSQRYNHFGPECGELPSDIQCGQDPSDDVSVVCWP